MGWREGYLVFGMIPFFSQIILKAKYDLTKGFNNLKK